jgi:hypothetical protein
MRKLLIGFLLLTLFQCTIATTSRIGEPQKNIDPESEEMIDPVVIVEPIENPIGDFSALEVQNAYALLFDEETIIFKRVDFAISDFDYIPGTRFWTDIMYMELYVTFQDLLTEPFGAFHYGQVVAIEHHNIFVDSVYFKILTSEILPAGTIIRVSVDVNFNRFLVIGTYILQLLYEEVNDYYSCGSPVRSIFSVQNDKVIPPGDFREELIPSALSLTAFLNLVIPDPA